MGRLYVLFFSKIVLIKLDGFSLFLDCTGRSVFFLVPDSPALGYCIANLYFWCIFAGDKGFFYHFSSTISVIESKKRGSTLTIDLPLAIFSGAMWSVSSLLCSLISFFNESSIILDRVGYRRKPCDYQHCLLTYAVISTLFQPY